MQAELTTLHHVGVCTHDLERTRRFYTEVLGLEDGHRGRLRRPGAWLYLNGVPIVHVITGRERPAGMTGFFDHFCLRARGFEAWKDKLDRLGVRYEEDGQEGGIRQLFFHDPNEVLIELNFGPEPA
ncbi:MAG TPA: VOC family protein [Ramlibacter sp.]|nr:VOC family protein [Ramlibacter sp.]